MVSNGPRLRTIPRILESAYRHRRLRLGNRTVCVAPRHRLKNGHSASVSSIHTQSQEHPSDVSAILLRTKLTSDSRVCARRAVTRPSVEHAELRFCCVARTDASEARHERPLLQGRLLSLPSNIGTGRDRSSVPFRRRTSDCARTRSPSRPGRPVAHARPGSARLVPPKE